MAPNALSDDGQRSFVDVSNIPFDTIEWIEILKDGASATYGSDAMAGVVNVILKKSFIPTKTPGSFSWGTTLVSVFPPRLECSLPRAADRA